MLNIIDAQDSRSQKIVFSADETEEATYQSVHLFVLPVDMGKRPWGHGVS